MKNLKLLNLLLLAVVVLSASCKKNNDEPTPVTSVNTIASSISTNTTLTANTKWILEGTVEVKDGATLTIEPGTVIEAKSDANYVLVVNRGGKIMAEGTVSKPIVFTASVKKLGAWGGIMLIGKATTNRTAAQKTEGFIQFDYGTDKVDNDNSGVLKYVRIEYAGLAYAPDKEINALSLYAVGNGTTLSYIETFYSNDDAFEFFGGTVNADHLVAYGTVDDDLDFDFGYNGTIQYAVALRVPEIADAKDAANGIELDNDATGTAATPISKPIVKYLTLIGPNGAANTAANHAYAARLRRSAKFDIQNTIFLGHQKGLMLESSDVATGYQNGQSTIKNIIIATTSSGSTQVPYWNVALNAETIFTSQTSFDAVFKVSSSNNQVLAVTDVKLTKPFDTTAPNFRPTSDSPALAGGIQIGAFDATTDWTAQWCRWGRYDQ